jgi:uncharacterized protein YqhQ
MDLNKIFIKNACPTRVGGQAVLEGIMMKGTDRLAVTVRKPLGGLHVKIDRLPVPSKWMKYPILRGVVAFMDSLIMGTKILLYSAEVLEELEKEEGKEIEKDKFTIWLEKYFGEKNSMTIMLYTSVVLALVFTVGVFIIFPTAAVNVFQLITTNEILLNLIEGVFRIVLFVGYILLISRMKDIRRVFEYHGAEHKTIHCFENGLDLTVENCKQFEPLHPRCGTSFLMFVMVISLLLFSLLGWPDLLFRIGSRLLLIPLIAGLSYELLRWAGRSNSWFVKILSLPGLALQKLTTREPDEKQLQVAIVSLKAVLNNSNDESAFGVFQLEKDKLDIWT